MSLPQAADWSRRDFDVTSLGLAAAQGVLFVFSFNSCKISTMMPHIASNYKPLAVFSNFVFVFFFNKCLRDCFIHLWHKITTETASNFSNLKFIFPLQNILGMDALRHHIAKFDKERH